MAADVLASLGATVACCLFILGGGIAASGASQRLLPGESLAGRVAAAVTLWHFLLVVLALPLLQLGLFSLPVAGSALGLAIAIVASFTWTGFRELLRDVLRSCTALDLSGLASWQRGIVWLAAGTVVCAVFRAFILPPLSWDSLIYHLWLPAEWVKRNGLYLFHAPENWDTCQFFPLNWEIIAAWMFRFAGDDRFINLINYPFLLQMFGAFYGLSRTFGIAPSRAFLGGLALCFNAAVFSYVNTAYVENCMTAHLLTGYLFLFRALDVRSRTLLGISMAAFGLAVGTKLVAIPHLAVALLGVLYMYISKARRPIRPVITGLVLLGILLAASSFWYLRAWVHTGSPLYPYGMSIAGVRLFPDSAKHQKYQDFLFNKAVEVSRNVPVSAVTPFLTLLPLATACGPLVLFLAPLIPWGLLRLGAGGGWGKMAILLAGAIFTMSGYYSERMFPIRFLWAVSSSRFLLFPLAVMLISALACFSGRGHTAMIEKTVWVCIASSLLLQIPLSWNTGWKFFNIILYSTLVAVALRGSLARSGPGINPAIGACAWGIIVFLIVWVGGAPFLQASLRHRALEMAYELHDFPRDQAPAWIFVDRPGCPFRISMSVGYDGLGGNNWFMYPLLGSRLQNTVFYTPITTSGEIVDTFLKVPEDVLPCGDRAAWLSRLRERADYLVLFHPFPPEAAWAAELPEDLLPVVSKEHVRIYKVCRPS